jgi:hypothetical protein
MNSSNTRRNLQKITMRRSQSPVARPIYAKRNNQNAFTGVAQTAETLNASSFAQPVYIQNVKEMSRPSSATAYAPIAPQSVSYNRPKSATLVPLSLSAEQAHQGQLKPFHKPLQHQEGSRSLIKTRRRKNRKSRKSRRNRRTTA